MPGVKPVRLLEKVPMLPLVVLLPKFVGPGVVAQQTPATVKEAPGEETVPPLWAVVRVIFEIAIVVTTGAVAGGGVGLEFFLLQLNMNPRTKKKSNFFINVFLFLLRNKN